MATLSVSSGSLRRQGDREPFLRFPNGFVLPGPGIYTLEGPNQSGKSLFIRMIMGMVTEADTGFKPPQISVDGRHVVIKNPADAYRAGIVAVFQDDDLLSTFTVAEHFYIRHGRTQLTDFVAGGYNLLHHFILHPVTGFLSWLNVLPPSVRNFFHRIEPTKIDWRNEQSIRRDASELLKRYYGRPAVEILDSTPPRLSGGARAIVKFVSAQLSRPLNVLLLDEAFSGVQRDLWPFLIDSIRKWAIDNGIAVLAISHNQAEIARWQPKARFEIRGGEIRSLEGLPVGNIKPGIPARNVYFPVYESPSELELLWKYNLRNDQRVAFLISKSVANLPATQRILQSLPLNSERHIITTDLCESENQAPFLAASISEVLRFMPRCDGAFAIIGGGLCLNVGLFVSAIINRGSLHTILVPTTLLAFADVAVGSKASANLDIGPREFVPNRLNVKHTVGVYHNPASVLLDQSYIANLPTIELKSGLSEFVKHGLLQSSELFTESLAEMRSSDPDVGKCIRLARQVMELKSEILEVDPFEEKYGKILLYGHLHAHALERVTNFELPHGLCVMLGMAIDLILGGDAKKLSQIVAGIRDFRPDVSRWLTHLDFDTLREIYRTSNKPMFMGREEDEYITIKVPRCGFYDITAIRQSLENEDLLGTDDFFVLLNQAVEKNEIYVSWESIVGAYGNLRTRLAHR